MGLSGFSGKRFTLRRKGQPGHQKLSAADERRLKAKLILGCGKGAFADFPIIDGAFHFRCAVESAGVFCGEGVAGNGEFDFIAFNGAGEFGVAKLPMIHTGDDFAGLGELEFRTAATGIESDFECPFTRNVSGKREGRHYEE